jgi:hypothetical protein
VPSGRSALLGRAGPAAPPALRARAQCGPLRADRALGVRNRHTFAESPCFIQSTESGADMGPVGLQNDPRALRGCTTARRRGGAAARLRCCTATRRHSRTAARRHLGTAAQPHGRWAARMHCCAAARLRGCTAARLHDGCTAARRHS